eukprot:TRINITY_DN505_c0_g1_i1.p1 TRINITY_DN505_c0_g1~~TRINITY_DN505_c0_g1_i1.p1  ORF type:complete len:628 (-),score=194.36 TRINITY_DN505_c0_g1_i1:260-2143(-)
MANQVIVVGGGLAGLSAAHTVLENGGNVVLLDKSPFCGGNSTKATSGINGSGTKSQRDHGIPDNNEIFEADTTASAKTGARPALIKVLTHESGPGVEWLINNFGLDLSLVSRLGGHTQPRTHRGKERFPGMTITYALMEKLEKIAEDTPESARVITKANVTELITENGAVVGCKYVKGGETFEERGPVVITTGGFGADFSNDSLLQQVSQEWRTLSAWEDVKQLPDLMSLPTTNGDHCTGDGVKMSMAVGGNTCDMEAVQVHPTGLVHPDEPDSKIKFLAAEALRGCGGMLIDGNGKRFVDELQKRDHVSGRMWNNQGPFRLILNSKASKEIEWHCKHYCGRGLMKPFSSGADIAKEVGVSTATIAETFGKYTKDAAQKKDPFGKKFFNNAEFAMDDHYHVAIVCPVIHYTMGGIEGDEDGRVLTKAGAVVEGLYTAGEAMGGVHGKNRLGGNSLLDCVAFGRVSGRASAKYLLQQSLKIVANRRMGVIGGHMTPAGGVSVNVTFDPANMSTNFNVSYGQASGASAPAQAAAAAAPAAAAAAPAVAAAPASASYTMGDVAKHNKADDCWVVVGDQVLNVTEFLPDHPGGKKAILLFAGKDATEEFDMLHKREVIEKYAPDAIIGKLA